MIRVVVNSNRVSMAMGWSIWVKEKAANKIRPEIVVMFIVYISKTRSTLTVKVLCVRLHYRKANNKLIARIKVSGFL
jgi:hypothetical protein